MTRSRTTTSSAAIEQAIQKAGSASDLARLLEISRQAVHAIQQRGVVSAQVAKKIEAKLGIPRAELAPDIYG
jgi:DNA-binding transcriptional regulator YdaS (Cro superfamily)